MARKKREEGGGNNAPWLNTFADLMNLLLCFFVLLFSMSTVDADQFEEITVSMANSFGVFNAGGSSIGDGQLISSGMTQLSDLSEYYSTMGQMSQSVENADEYNKNDEENTQEGTEGTEGTAGAEGTESTQSTAQSSEEELTQAVEKIKQEMEAVSSQMYDQVSTLTEQYNLGSYVELSMDPEYQFVQLTLKGSILFASGEADIKKEAKPILSKIGEILKKFDGYTIEITGHTDNVPMHSAAFPDNNWLSSARALNAAEYLINSCAVDPATLKYSGRGEYEPISSNATSEGRAKNRRIEVKIYNEYSGK